MSAEPSVDECERRVDDLKAALAAAKAELRAAKERASHGTRTRYTSGCRCADCTNANTAWTSVRRAERAQQLAADPSRVPHGKPSTYSNWGCRCGPCKAAVSAMNHAYYEQRKAAS